MQNTYTHYAGFDWAKDHHEIVIVDDRGKIVTQFTLEHNLEGWQRWQDHLAKYETRLAVCVETSQGAMIEQLLQSSCTIYPVQPRSANATGRGSSMRGVPIPTILW